MKNYYDLKNELPFMLSELHPEKVVYLTRKNVSQQAVSYHKAIETNAWFDGASAKKKPAYSFQRIRACEEKIRLQLDFWKQFFEAAKPDVKRVYYEDLISNQNAFISDVADFLGIRTTFGNLVSLPNLRVQRDSRSLEWATRYQEEKMQLLEREATSTYPT